MEQEHLKNNPSFSQSSLMVVWDKIPSPKRQKFQPIQNTYHQFYGTIFKIGNRAISIKLIHTYEINLHECDSQYTLRLKYLIFEIPP